MGQLTIAISNSINADLLYERLGLALDHHELGCRASILKRDHCLEIEYQVDDFSSTLSELNQIVSRVIAHFLVDDQEAAILRKSIFQQQAETDDEDIQQIIEFSQHMLEETEAYSEGITIDQGRRNVIYQELYTYSCAHSHLNVEGFVRFRLKSYRLLLKETVEYALEEFILNRQYQEFIALLKYFVYFQEAKIPEAHLFHHGSNRFMLLDGAMNPLDIHDAEEVVVETIDRELNYEDTIVSTLISASPSRIYIHTREPETQSIKTIQQIFEGRTILCP